MIGGRYYSNCLFDCQMLVPLISYIRRKLGSFWTLEVGVLDFGSEKELFASISLESKYEKPAHQSESFGENLKWPDS